MDGRFTLIVKYPSLLDALGGNAINGDARLLIFLIAAIISSTVKGVFKARAAFFLSITVLLIAGVLL